MTLTEFYDALEAHDWYFTMSDDHSVWTRGLKRNNELREISKQSPDHKALWVDWNRYMFGTPGYSADRGQKPARPQ